MHKAECPLALPSCSVAHLADPVMRTAGVLGDGRGGPPFGEQPEDLKPTAFVPFLGSSIARLELVHGQMRRQVNASRHATFYNDQITIGIDRRRWLAESTPCEAASNGGTAHGLRDGQR